MPIKTVQVDDREELKKLFNIFKIEEKAQSNELTQEEVDFGRKLVEKMAELQKENANKLLDLLKPGTLNEDEAKEGRKLVEMLAELPYEFPRATVAVDVVVFGILPGKDELHVFVHRPKGEGKWWLPGRFMHSGGSYLDEIDNKEGDNWTIGDTLWDAMNRRVSREKKVYEKVILNGVEWTREEEQTDYLSYTIKPNIDLICQLEARSALNRDDRGKRVVSVPYMTLIRVNEDIPSDSDFNKEYYQWKPVSELIKVNENFAEGDEKLAHDHFKILKNGLKRLFQEVRTRPIGGSKDVYEDVMTEDEVFEDEVGKDIIRNHIQKEDSSNIDDYFLLPSEFDISHLINIYNVVLKTMGVTVERSNLKKLLIDRKVVKEVDDRNQSRKGDVTYKFDPERYNRYKKYLDFAFNQNQRKPRVDHDRCD